MGDFFMKKDLVVSGVYIASLIGAGFASGGEIVHYFAVYGKWGIFGIIISSVLFGLMATAILEISKQNKSYSFSEFLEDIFGNRLAKIINAVTVLFMMCVFTAMISGSGETVSEIIGCGRMSGVIVMLIIISLILMFDVRGLLAVNGVMGILIVAGTLGVCTYLINFREVGVFRYYGDFLCSGTGYAGYNILTAGTVLPAMTKYAENNKRIGVVSAAVIFVLLFVMWVIISIYYGKIPLGEIPMLTICKRHGMVVSIIYSIVLFAAMFTTALSNGFALMDSVKGRKGIKIAMLLVVSFYASGLPFDFFVGKLYRYIGYVGFLLCFFILLKFSKKIKLVRKKTKNEENER